MLLRHVPLDHVEVGAAEVAQLAVERPDAGRPVRAGVVLLQVELVGAPKVAVGAGVPVAVSLVAGVVVHGVLLDGLAEEGAHLAGKLALLLVLVPYVNLYVRVLVGPKLAPRADAPQLTGVKVLDLFLDVDVGPGVALLVLLEASLVVCLVVAFLTVEKYLFEVNSSDMPEND